MKQLELAVKKAFLPWMNTLETQMTTEVSDPIAIDRRSFAYTYKLFQAIERRHDILAALQQLNESQAKLTQDQDVSTTLGLLSRKQGLLDELSEIGDELRPFAQDDPDQRRWESNELREKCRMLVNAGDQLLHQSVQIEESTLKELTTRRDAVAAQLRNGTDSISARNAYSAGNALDVGELDIGDL